MKNKKFYIISLIVILVLCAIYASQTKTITTTENNDYKNISYNIENQNVTLKNGESIVQSAIPGGMIKTITKYFGNEAKGDFDNDGREDIAFLLTQQTGGSGTFYYVVVALNKETGYIGTNAIFLGDRISPQNTNYINKEIVVNYATRKNGEPMTANPSVGVSKIFHIKDGKLVAL